MKTFLSYRDPNFSLEIVALMVWFCTIAVCRATYLNKIPSNPFCFLCFQGDGVGGARVYVDSEEVTSTDPEGHYQLLDITTGRYNIKVSLCQTHPLFLCCGKA